MVSILGSVDPEWKELLGGIPAHDSATLNLGFRRDQVGHPLDGFGFVVPDNEGALMLGTTFSSLKFAGRAPEGHVLLRTFLGRKAAMALDIEGERETLRKVFAEVAKVLKVKGEPIVSKLARYRSSMSYYTPGHLSRADRIQRKSAETPGLFFAGNGLMGSGIPDCIASGEQAAESLLTHA
jgi:oxygen-dependent protoporphyrinogen oxidase